MLKIVISFTQSVHFLILLLIFQSKRDYVSFKTKNLKFSIMVFA